jgi:phage FluMu gp28-like protein
LAEDCADEYGHDRIHQVMLTEKWYAENLPLLKTAFEDATIEIPRDAETKDDLRAVKMINGVPKIPKTTGQGKKGEKRHGDAAVMLAMLWFASLQDGTPIEFETSDIERTSSGSGFANFMVS